MIIVGVYVVLWPTIAASTQAFSVSCILNAKKNSKNTEIKNAMTHTIEAYGRTKSKRCAVGSLMLLVLLLVVLFRGADAHSRRRICNEMNKRRK